VTWAVLTTPSSEPDLAALSPTHRLAVLDDLAAWTGPGPPRTPLRGFAGAVLFEDPLPCGFSVAYLLSDAEYYIAVVRLRPTFP